MSFYLCEKPMGDSGDYLGVNLDNISTFFANKSGDGTPRLSLMMKDGSTAEIVGHDALKLLYAMKISTPKWKR